MKSAKRFSGSALTGAVFLMATSAIGPGFLTQTALFTGQLMASFGFVILVSIILDIGAQLNTWRILAVSEQRAQDIANKVFPGLGFLLSLLVVTGGMAFNVGNLAGTGLGINVLFGTDVKTGAVISATIAILIFLVREAGKMMDGFAKLLGIVMIGLTLYVAISSHPPLDEVVQKTFWPDTIDMTAIITLVGGTVGGYISFAGGHRLLDAGIKGKESLPQASRSAVSAILLASAMRILLFLAALGVVMSGMTLDHSNPAASVFRLAAGNTGYKVFGIVMWCAAITSVVGSAYTSVSFIKTFHPGLPRFEKFIIIAFIIVSLAIFLVVGQPVKTLVMVGTVNGFILPLSLGVMLIAAHRSNIVKDYKHPVWLTVFGILVIVATLWMGVKTLGGN